MIRSDGTDKESRLPPHHATASIGASDNIGKMETVFSGLEIILYSHHSKGAHRIEPHVIDATL